MAQLKQQNDRMQKILRRQTAPGSADEEKAKGELKQIVNAMIDYGDLAKRALATHWDKLTPAQREEFTATLRELIEKNYVRQLRTNLDYELVYKGETMSGDEATVVTVVKAKTQGKTTEVGIDYKLHHSGGRWQIHDVVTDEVSMVKNYRAQFNKIIAGESYEALIKKMRKKMDEVDGAKPAKAT